MENLVFNFNCKDGIPLIMVYNKYQKIQDNLRCSFIKNIITLAEPNYIKIADYDYKYININIPINFDQLHRYLLLNICDWSTMEVMMFFERKNCLQIFEHLLLNATEQTLNTNSQLHYSLCKLIPDRFEDFRRIRNIEWSDETQSFKHFDSITLKKYNYEILPYNSCVTYENAIVFNNLTVNDLNIDIPNIRGSVYSKGITSRSGVQYDFEFYIAIKTEIEYKIETIFVDLLKNTRIISRISTLRSDGSYSCEFVDLNRTHAINQCIIWL